MRKVEEVWHRIRHRDGLRSLPAHLERTHDIRITGVCALEAGVLRIERGADPAWVARIFPGRRTQERAQGDAQILRLLELHGVPAERLACAEPVSLHEGQAVLVTRFVEGHSLGQSDEKVFAALGSLLGRLHGLPAPCGLAARAGGAIHSLTLAEGELALEIDQALGWLAEAEIPADERGAYERLREAIARTDLGKDLPHALSHPDPIPLNAIAADSGELVLVDWTGAGVAPRVHALAFLLLAAVAEGRWNPGDGRVDAALEGYRRHVQLTEPEIAAIAAVFPLHIFVRDAAECALGRAGIAEVSGAYEVISRVGLAVADRARRTFAG